MIVKSDRAEPVALKMQKRTVLKKRVLSFQNPRRTPRSKTAGTGSTTG